VQNNKISNAPVQNVMKTLLQNTIATNLLQQYCRISTDARSAMMHPWQYSVQILFAEHIVMDASWPRLQCFFAV